MNSKPSLDTILFHWRDDCGDFITSKNGFGYFIVPMKDRDRHLLNLLQTLSDLGYSEREIRSPEIPSLVVNFLWPDYSTDANFRQLHRSRAIAYVQWNKVVKTFFKQNV